MVDESKGATVKLVKSLSDDIRMLPNGTKAESAGAAVRQIHDELESEINSNAENIGKLIIPAGEKTYIAQLAIVNGKPILAYDEGE